LLCGQRYEFFSFLYGSGERLFAEHMLARPERILGHRKMLRVGCTYVYGIDRRIAQDVAVVGRRRGDGEARPQASRGFGVSSRNCHRFDELHPPRRFKMHPAHEPGAENRHSD
jgi:hypothetical protein